MKKMPASKNRSWIWQPPLPLRFLLVVRELVPGRGFTRGSPHLTAHFTPTDKLITQFGYDLCCHLGFERTAHEPATHCSCVYRSILHVFCGGWPRFWPVAMDEE